LVFHFINYWIFGPKSPFRAKKYRGASRRIIGFGTAAALRAALLDFWGRRQWETQFWTKNPAALRAAFGVVAIDPGPETFCLSTWAYNQFKIEFTVSTTSIFVLG
jgi:hypothetical protein